MTATAEAPGAPLARDDLERAERGAAARVAHAGLVVARRNLKHFTRLPRLLVFSTIQPVMFVLLFAFVFDGAIRGALPDGFPSYLSFVMPGIFIQSTVFRMTQTAVGLAEDLDKGVIDRFRSMPIPRSAVLVGRTIADLVRSMTVIVLMVAVGVMVGFRFQRGALAAVGALLVVGMLGYALSWVFVFVALWVPGAESAQAAAFVAAFPLSFVSSVFVPVRTYSIEWLQVLARWSPVTAAADASRGLAVAGPVMQPLMEVTLWSVALLAVFIPLSVARFRRIQ